MNHKNISEFPSQYLKPNHLVVSEERHTSNIQISQADPIRLKKSDVVMKASKSHNMSRIEEFENHHRRTKNSVGINKQGRPINIANVREQPQMQKDGPVISYAVKTRQGYIPG